MATIRQRKQNLLTDKAITAKKPRGAIRMGTGSTRRPAGRLKAVGVPLSPRRKAPRNGLRLAAERRDAGKGARSTGRGASGAGGRR